MFEDVKIYTSSDKDSIEKFIIEYSDKGYYKSDFRTDIVYRSFNFSWDNHMMYTIVMVKYKEEPETKQVENWTVYHSWMAILLDNDNQNVTEISGEGGLSTITEQVHSEEWRCGKKRENSEKEVSTTSDSSSVHES